MKAVRIHEFGSGPQDLLYEEEQREEKQLNNT
jgi:hypothetical protein